MVEKDMRIAIIISVLFTGLGVAYAGNVKKGVALLGAAVFLNVLGMWTSSIFNKISILLWIYGLYATYLEVKAVNGE